MIRQHTGRLRPACHFTADSDWRHGGYYRSRILCNDFRPEDFFDAAQYHAGAISAPKVGGIVRLTGFIVRVTLVAELLCAAVMAPVFCRDFGKIGLWMALFHSVSAFCNAGFDLLGVRTPFSSLTSYAANPVINLRLCS